MPGRQGAQDDPAGRDRHPTPDGSARRPARRHRHCVVRRRGPGQDPGQPRLPSPRSQVARGIAQRPGPPRPRPRPQPALGRQEVAQGSQEGPALLLLGLEPAIARSAPTPAPQVGVLVLDIDEPAKFRKWIEAPLWDPRDLGDCLVSYHRKDSAEAVRSGAAKGKLIFKFEADADHPLARIGKAALRSEPRHRDLLRPRRPDHPR